VTSDSTDGAAIGELMVRYATAVDTRDWDLLRACFTDDAVTDYEDVGSWTTAAELVSFMESAHVGFGRSNHMLSNLSVSVAGDRATAHSYVHAVLRFLDARAGWVEVVGSYDDALVRTPDGWRIATRSFAVTRMLSGANRA
jgi:3-phenylpropionate/cinnamic acid dioxygenase small subunit